MTTDPDDIQTALAVVGPRLRAVRRERKVTLAELAKTTGISVSTLSRLESGSRRPTLELLLPLARAHRIALDELVGAPQTGDPRVHPKPIHRHGTTYIPLARNLGGLQAYKQILPGAKQPAEPTLATHEGYEWVYVLAGRLRLVLGDRDLELGAGEAAEFDTRVPHWLSSAGPQPVELLTLYGPQGERVHVRARTTRSAPTP